jgi:quinol monooxygenase YgiN
MKVPERIREETIQTFQSMQGPIEAQPGCLSSCFYQDVFDPTRFGMIQEWRSEADLTRFLGSREYRRTLEVMELSSAAPEVKFYEVRHLHGLEFVEDVRLSKSQEE